MHDTKKKAFFEATYISHHTVMFGTFSCHDGLHQVVLDDDVIPTKGACHEESHVHRIADTYTDPVPGACETEVLVTTFHDATLVR